MLNQYKHNIQRIKLIQLNNIMYLYFWLVIFHETCIKATLIGQLALNMIIILVLNLLCRPM